jgi:hypothetical protein
MNPQAIATEFLDQWERAHSVDEPDYDRLAAKYAAYTGQVSLGDADAVGKDLARRPQGPRLAGPEACPARLHELRTNDRGRDHEPLALRTSFKQNEVVT